MCSCEHCVLGNFIKCPEEQGQYYFFNNNSEDSDVENNDSDVEINEEECETIDEECDEYEIRGDVVLDAIADGSFIAVYSQQNGSEIFYLCEVVSHGIAENDLSSLVFKGSKYMKCKYLEKIKEVKRYDM